MLGKQRDASVVELSSSALGEEIETAARPWSDDAPTLVRSDDKAPALIGSLISERYRVHELIGQGGMGAVYRGEQVHLRKQVAIKVLHPSARNLPQIVARFEREAIAGAHIQHPNVVSASDFGQLADRSHFLVLEYVEGAPLQDVIASAPLPARRALHIARQIASALEAVHAKGIVHRDVKPQNILLDARDQVKLIDFGLAKVNVELLSTESREATRKGHDLTAADQVLGTLRYLAPEAVRGMDAVDARADLYALGIILYEMLSGRGPFDASDGQSSFRQRLLEDAPPLRQRAPGLGFRPDVEAIVMWLVQRDPTQRYPTATSVIAAIDAAIAAMEGAPRELEPTVTMHHGAPGHPTSATSRASGWTSPAMRPWLIASVVVSLLLSVALLIAILLS
ncbi:serine/threonine-protein kinase [Sorangium sp. So ce394]|uniref:serine/threonine-protein kinase n=1 Tax=Sorangium sp. So ce394 TaxID=3133310 RepID=UPI003F5B7DB8